MSHYKIIAGIIAIATALGVVHLLRSDTEVDDVPIQPGPSAQATPQTIQQAIEEQGEQYGYRLPGMDCLVNEFGIRRKVVVTADNIRATETPGGTETGAPLGFFLPYFVFDVEPKTGEPEHFLIGSAPRSESVIGWVDARVAGSWDTRVGARLVDRSMPFNVYATEEDLAAAISDPNADVLPIARAASDAPWTWMPWPIVESRRREIDGRIYELHKLLFMARVTEATASSAPVTASGHLSLRSEQEFADARTDLRKVDIVFCVDNTMSTTDHVPQIRDSLKRISEQVTKQHGENDPLDVRFRLVLYRDYVAEIMYPGHSVVWSYPQNELADHLESFLERIDGITAATYGSQDQPEAVYDGLREAIGNTPWRGQGLAKHIVVLVGDDPAHEPGDPKNPHNISHHDIIQMASDESRDVSIVAVCVGDSGDLESLKRGQFQSVAEATGGTCHNISDTSDVIDQLFQLVGTARYQAEVNVDLLNQLQRGVKPGDLAAQVKTDPDRVTEFLELLVAAGYDLSTLSPGDSIPQTGWCLAELDGAAVLEKNVYVARAELQTLMSELSLLSIALEADGSRKIHELVLAGRINPASFFRDDNPDQTMDQFLMASGVPCSQGILRLTREEVVHMPEEERYKLKLRIMQQHQPMLLNALTNSRYFNFRDDNEFGWIPDKVFP